MAKDKPRIVIKSPDSVHLPANVDAERSVLGAALIHHDAALYVAEHVTADDFSREAHRTIYEALLGLHARKMVADYVTLKNYLGERNELERVGGPAYIASLTDGLPRATNIEFYARVLREQLIQRELIIVSWKIMEDVANGELDSRQLLDAADKRLLDIGAKGVRGELVNMSRSVPALIDDLERRIALDGALSGIDTGLTMLNEYTGGWQRGDFVLIAARPSIGKTALGLNCALTAARLGKKVAFFSIEMARQQIEYRLVSTMTNVMLYKIIHGRLGVAEQQAIGAAFLELEQLPIYIDDAASTTTQELRGKLRRMKLQEGLDLVFVDYIQLVKGSLGRRDATRNEEVTDISARMKELGKDLDVPMIALAQLKRAAEGRENDRPKMSDLRESGALEQDADLILMPHRPNHKVGGLAELIVEKQRNGPTGDLQVFFEKEIVRFRDAEASDFQVSDSESESSARATSARKAQGRVSRPAPASQSGHLYT